MIDYYEVLGVSPEADVQQITSAYRRLALQYHPDKARQNGDPQIQTDKFAQINEAYRLLLDKNGRAALDRLLAVSRAVSKRKVEMDERRRALKEDLLFREDQFRREQEQREAERVLKRELARVQAEEEERRRREQEGRGETEEQCTIRYTKLQGKTNVRDLFPTAINITTNNSNDGGLIVFDSLAAAQSAMTMSLDGIILEWVIEPVNPVAANATPRSNVDYQKMTEEELERYTIDRLRQMSQPPLPNA